MGSDTEALPVPLHMTDKDAEIQVCARQLLSERERGMLLTTCDRQRLLERLKSDSLYLIRQRHHTLSLHSCISI